jgi:hypothetical protein
MSLKELQEDFTKIIKPQLEEILRLLKNQQNADNIEAAAAKIINEIKSVIHNCPCNKEILDVLKTGTSNREIIIADEKFKRPLRYSYPNIGNEEIGTEKDQEKLSWPFGIIKKPT